MKVDTNLVIGHLVKTWGEHKQCPMCGHTEWTVSEMIVELREYHQGNLVAGGSVFPSIPITCTNCATSQFVNAILLGLVDAGEEND